MRIFKQGCQKKGIIHISMMKNWASHILFLKKGGLTVYLAALKRGAFRLAHQYYVIYRSLAPRGVYHFLFLNQTYVVGSFKHPKHMFKLMGEKIFTNLRSILF